MQIIKSLRKTIATVAVFASLAGSAHAASVPVVNSYNVSANQTFNITTGSTDLPSGGVINGLSDIFGAYYEFVTGSSPKTLILSLLSTNPALMQAKYTLYEDSNSIIGLGNTKPATANSVTLTDVLAGQDPKAIFTLAANSQYLLHIDPQNARRGIDGASPVVTQVSAVPLPAAFWMFGSAILGFFGFANRRKV